MAIVVIRGGFETTYEKATSVQIVQAEYLYVNGPTDKMAIGPLAIFAPGQWDRAEHVGSGSQNDD
ncbi:hypothetical protein [Amycolatopsis sp. NBC_01480]|uniref:hypothetical protein n=1 Tax=Amycolatopsis sp. NBC_01480 TaxID=2903562 RepID=UPI002E289C78|nr:hypothetical protein [Amycolatopsis sp. NBC_01480]